jgi:hypothetical protein
MQIGQCWKCKFYYKYYIEINIMFTNIQKDKKCSMWTVHRWGYDVDSIDIACTGNVKVSFDSIKKITC